MALTLVTGPANSAKAEDVLGGFRAAQGRAPLLVVPTTADARHYERELAEEGALLGGAVTTFAGLARAIARATGYAGRPVGPVARARLVAEAVAAARLGPFAELAAQPGFARAAERFVVELEQALVDPGRLTAALRTWAAGDARRGARAEALGSLYGGYARALDRRGVVDADVFLRRALDALRAAPGTWGDRRVFFYGFDDLTALERDAVETLARVVGTEVVVSLSYEPGRAAFAGRARTVEELRPLAAELIERPARADHYADPALHRLERGLFAEGVEPGPPTTAVQVLAAGGEHAELELVAEEIRELLEAGVAPGEVAVVVRAPARIASLAAQVLGAAGVPFGVAGSLPLADTALGGGVLALAGCALGDAEAAALLRWLRTPGVLRRPELADRLEAELRRAGRTELAAAHAAWAAIAPDLPLRDLDRLAGAAASGSAFAAALRHIAARAFAAPHRGTARVLEADERVDARALEAVLGALADLEAVGGAPEPAALVEQLAGVPVALADPPGEEAVLVADPLGLRARRFRAVFLCGLQEGEWPRAADPDPFLDDAARRELASASGLVLPLREDPLADERHLFYAAATRPTDRLVLSYRTADEEGQALLASPFVGDVTGLFTEVERRERPLGSGTGAGAGAPEPPIAPLTAASTGRLRQREVVSPGALESFARCPVRWLVERELEPEPLEPDAEPLRRGDLIHRVLERVIRAAGPITDATLPAAEAELAEALVDEGSQIRLAEGDTLHAAALRRVEADLHRYLRHEADAGAPRRFAPEFLELRFGMGDDEGALPALALGDGEVRVRGIIDRVDTDGAGHAVVRDYKSGRADATWPVGRWRRDSRLQVALYLVAVRELLGLDPVAGLYQPLRGGDLRARGVVREGVELDAHAVPNDERYAEELEAELDAAGATAVELARALRAGEIRPCPETCGRDGCAYPGICRSGG